MILPPQTANQTGRKAASAAFSLLELLAAILIMGALAGVLIPAVGNLSKTSALGQEGTRVSDLADFARQNAISKGAMTALVMSSDPMDESRNRTFALFELAQRSDGTEPVSSDWKQITRWEKLRDGTIADLCTLPDQDRPPPVPFASVRAGSRLIGAYHYALFVPDGSMLESTPAKIRLAEGFWPANASSPTYTRPKPGGGPANYFQIHFLPSTGRQKIERP